MFSVYSKLALQWRAANVHLCTDSKPWAADTWRNCQYQIWFVRFNVKDRKFCKSPLSPYEEHSMYFYQMDKRVMKEFKKHSIWRVGLRIQSIYHQRILKCMKGSKKAPEFKHLQMFPAIFHMVKTEQNNCLHKQRQKLFTQKCEIKDQYPFKPALLPSVRQILFFWFFLFPTVIWTIRQVAFKSKQLTTNNIITIRRGKTWVRHKTTSLSAYRNAFQSVHPWWQQT